MADVTGLGPIWTWQEAVHATCRATVAARMRTGAWQSPFRGIYAHGGRELTAADWALAATLASGGRPTPGGVRAVASGRTAARVWQLPLIDDLDPATGAQDRFLHEVTTRRSLSKLSAARIDGDPRCHELQRVRRALEATDVLWHAGGFWLTTALRTAIDCVPALGMQAGVCLLDDGLHRGLFSVPDLERELARRTGRPGSRALARAVALADGRSESAAESLARLLLLPILPGLVPQVRIWDGHRVVARVDLGDEEIRLALEVDGKRGHSGEAMVAKDRARDRRLERLGWWTERCTWWDLRCDADDLVERMVWRDALLRHQAA